MLHFTQQSDISACHSELLLPFDFYFWGSSQIFLTFNGNQTLMTQPLKVHKFSCHFLEIFTLHLFKIILN